MKISVLQENLKLALSSVKRVIPSRPQLPVLSSVLFSVSKEGIFLLGTDLYTGMKIQVKGSVEHEGQVAVPAAVLFETISSLSPGKVVLEKKEGSLSVSTTQSSVSIQCFSSEEFPEFPEKEGQEVRLSWDLFEKIVTFVPLATAKDDSRPVLTSVLFDMNTGENPPRVVGTDGFRMSVLSAGKNDLVLPEKLAISQMLLPAKAVQEVRRVLSQDEKKEVLWTLSTKMKQAFFSTDEVGMVVRLMDGEFPPYQKILPEQFSSVVEIDAEALLQNLKGAMVFAKEASQIVTLSFEDSHLVVSATSPSIGSHQSEVACSVVRGKPDKIAFNAAYIIEMIQAIKPQKLIFSMNESLQPAQFQVDEEPTFRYIVMPFRVSE